MIDPNELRMMTNQIYPDLQAPQPTQAALPPPTPEQMLGMVGVDSNAPVPMMTGTQLPGAPGVPPMMPGQGAVPGDAPEAPAPAPDLVPTNIIENIARYAADKSVQLADRLVSLAGPSMDSQPTNQKMLVSIWLKRVKTVTDEMVAGWRNEGVKEGEILKRTYPGRFALLNMGHWRPGQKVKFSNAMALLVEKYGGEVVGSSEEDDETGQVEDDGTVVEGEWSEVA